MNLNAQPQPDLNKISALGHHFQKIILPLWQSNGWNSDLRLPYESLDSASGLPLVAKYYRAMACARQLYIFSHEATSGSTIAARADELFASLQFYFSDSQGGWIYSVDATGRPLDETQDLYTYAFIIFACAEYYKKSENPSALQVMLQTIELVEQLFSDSNGLYVAALGKDFVGINSRAVQNPIMHLTEAYLSAYRIDGDLRHQRRLQEIGANIIDRFVDKSNGCIAESPQGEPGNHIEPGHQFEWFSLVIGCPEVFGGSELELALRRAFCFAQLYGVDSSALGVKASISTDGKVLDARQRIWAQTEFARALAVEGSPQSIMTLTRWAEYYRIRFLHTGGWHELLDTSGNALRMDMPSSTPYHLFSAYSTIQAL
jgi:mannose/cellobiose epimerase-like protein (N-acyl-D-glucosamine 2-epimerase family)